MGGMVQISTGLGLLERKKAFWKVGNTKGWWGFLLREGDGRRDGKGGDGSAVWKEEPLLDWKDIGSCGRRKWRFWMAGSEEGWIVYLTSREVKDRICQLQDKDRSLRSSEVIADVDLSQAENKLQLVNGIRQK